jgi:hypothetical protein
MRLANNGPAEGRKGAPGRGTWQRRADQIGLRFMTEHYTSNSTFYIAENG